MCNTVPIINRGLAQRNPHKQPLYVFIVATRADGHWSFEADANINDPNINTSVNNLNKYILFFFFFGNDPSNPVIKHY